VGLEVPELTKKYMKNKTKNKSTKSPKVVSNHDIFRLNNQVVKQVKAKYAEYDLDLSSKTTFITNDLENSLVQYSLSEKGTLSKLSKGKRSFPKLDISLSAEASVYNVSDTEVYKVKVVAKIAKGKLDGVEFVVKPVNETVSVSSSVYDIFKFDFARAFSKVQDVAIKAYVKVSSLIR
jgi:hypothetical protein